MADTSPQPVLSEPHTNGVMDGLTEEEKSKMRPADIDAVRYERQERKKSNCGYFISLSMCVFSNAYAGYEGNGEKEKGRNDDEFTIVSRGVGTYH